jgi:phage gp16-like protein
VDAKKSAHVSINIQSADIELGIANVLMALQQCGVVEMPRFLQALEQVTDKTHWLGPEGQKNPSRLSRNLIRHLQKLSQPDSNADNSDPRP